MQLCYIAQKFFFVFSLLVHAVSTSVQNSYNATKNQGNGKKNVTVWVLEG